MLDRKIKNINDCIKKLFVVYEMAHMDIKEEALIHYNKGLKFFKDKSYTDAQTEFNKAVLLDSSNAIYHNELGNAYINCAHHAVIFKHEYDFAIEQYKIAIYLNPNIPDFHHNLGIAYFYKNMYSEAIKEFQTAIDLNPSASQHYYFIGILLFKWGLKDVGIEKIKKAISLEEDNATYLKTLENLEKEYHDGVKSLRDKEKEEALKVHQVVKKTKKEDKQTTKANETKKQPKKGINRSQEDEDEEEYKEDEYDPISNPEQLYDGTYLENFSNPNSPLCPYDYDGEPRDDYPKFF